MELFDYAVIFTGLKRKESDGGGWQNGKEPKVLKRDSVLAVDEDQARVKVAREIPDEHMADFDHGRVEIVVRPFGE